MSDSTLQVYSIYSSISGEGGDIPQGAMTTFVRLAGCNLRCSYCDTKKTWSPLAGQPMSITDAVYQIIKLGNTNILITGGEPLLQWQDVCKLIYALGNLNVRLKVQIETGGGTHIFSRPFPFVEMAWVVDYKLPSSDMMKEMLVTPDTFLEWELPQNTHIKFVISDKQDFMTALKIVTDVEDIYKHDIIGPWPIKSFLFSTAHEHMTPAELISLMNEYDLNKPIHVPCIFNLQIHKYIWPEGEKEK